MRLLKFLAFLLVLQLISWIPEVNAQDSVLTCARIHNNFESNRDTIKINRFSGKPGDTVFMPIYISTDSVCASFSLIIHYDTTKLSPVVVDSNLEILVRRVIDGIDTTFDTTLFMHYYLDYELAGRLQAVQDSQNTYPSPAIPFFVEKSFDTLDDGAVIINFNTGLLDQYVYMLPGNGVVMTIPMVINASVPHKDSTVIDFPESPLLYDEDPDDIVDPIVVGCRLSQLASVFRDIDGNFGVPVALFPTHIFGRFVADTAPLPNINAFAASRSTITSGSFSILNWNVSNADSVVLFANNVRVMRSTFLVDDTTVSPTATTTYRLTAYNNNGSISASQNVNVTTGGGGGGGTGGGSTNYGPDIIRDPDGRTITMNQFETLTIRVTGDDPNGDSIFLSTLEPPPANSTFLGDSANGTGYVERVFSFTPDASQTGAFHVRFACWDEFGGSTANYLTIIVNPLDDILFTTSDTIPGRRSVGGVPGSSEILFPINFYTSRPIYGIQYDLTFDSLQLEIDSVFTTSRMPGFVVYDNIGQVPGVVRVASFHLSGDSMLNDTIPIMYAAFSIDSLATPGLYEICIKNGVESIDPNPNVFGVSVAGSCGVLQIDQFGDVNLDRHVNVVDVVNIIGVIIGNYSLSPRQFAAGNVVNDANVDVFDMVGILNIIFDLPLVPTAGMEIPGIIAEMSLNYEPLAKDASSVVNLDIDVPLDIAGVELVINYDPTAVILGVPQVPAGQNKLNVSSRDVGQGKMKVLLSPTDTRITSEFIQSGKSTFLTIPITARTDIASNDESKLRLTQALLSTGAAEAVKVGNVTAPVPAGFTLRQNYPNPFNPSTHIEFSIDVDAGVGQKNVRLDIFNILGQRVKTLVNRPLSTGTFREVWDATNESGEKVSTGMYLYRLEVGDAAQTKKMIFLK